jgi:hypothetical protein
VLLLKEMAIKIGKGIQELFKHDMVRRSIFPVLYEYNLLLTPLRESIILLKI